MNYKKIADRIDGIYGSKQIGIIDDKYPFYIINSGVGQKKVLISGGVHGDEPAGVYAVIDFFENHAKPYLSDFEFTAFPCVNPYGFENCARGNSQGLNLNREFKIDTIADENRLIIPKLEKYLFFMDFHETMREFEMVGEEPIGTDYDEFYLWEICKNHDQRIGLDIVRNVEKAGLKVCKETVIFGDRNNGGVIWYPEDAGTPCYALDSVFDSYMESNHTSQAFTIETPRDAWTLEKRVLAHIISLRTALDKNFD